MANMDPQQVIAELTGKVCKEAWLPGTYSSSNDTPETVDSVRAGNRARSAFCHE